MVITIEERTICQRKKSDYHTNRTVHTGSEGMNEARVELLLDTKKCTHMRLENIVDSSSAQHYVGAVAL